MIVQIEDYQIRPHSNGLCWELWRHREVKSKDAEGNEQTRMDWVTEKIYPSTFGLALHHVWERLLKEGTEVVGLDEAMVKAERMQLRLMDVECACEACEKEEGNE